MRLSWPCSMAIASTFRANWFPRITDSHEYPPQSPCQEPSTRLPTKTLREKVASIPLVGAKEKSFAKKRLSLEPPAPESMVDCPAQRKSPSPECVIELWATTLRELCSYMSSAAESCPRLKNPCEYPRTFQSTRLCAMRFSAER